MPNPSTTVTRNAIIELLLLELTNLSAKTDLPSIAPPSAVSGLLANAAQQESPIPCQATSPGENCSQSFSLPSLSLPWLTA